MISIFIPANSCKHILLQRNLQQKKEKHEKFLIVGEAHRNMQMAVPKDVDVNLGFFIC